MKRAFAPPLGPPSGVRVTRCPCGADVFDAEHKHSPRCRARRDLLDAFDDAIDAGVTVTLIPAVIVMRAIEWAVIAAREVLG